MCAGIALVEGERKQEDRESGINWGRMWKQVLLNQSDGPLEGSFPTGGLDAKSMS